MTQTANGQDPETTRRPSLKIGMTRLRVGERPIATGSYQILADGTVLHYRPYEANGISADDVVGRNLFGEPAVGVVGVHAMPYDRLDRIQSPAGETWDHAPSPLSRRSR